ncbi:MAG: pseudouridine synthase [Sandaracinaceae bacterium]
MAAVRLQKILAHAGVASRRASEALVQAGRVRVNGRVVTELGTRADPHKDKIEVDGRTLAREKPAYYLVHKPREMVTSLGDPEGRTHLGDLLERVPERVYPVGRLDYHTSGALLVTNDGDLTDALLHPRRKVPKVYAAKVRGHLDVPELDRLRNGVELDDGYVTRPAEVFVLREEARHTWIQVTLTEGKNRQIHRMGDAIGHPVLRLVRTSFAGLDTEGLRPGQMRPLRGKEIEKLKKQFLTPSRRAKAAAARSAEGDGLDDPGPRAGGKGRSRARARTRSRGGASDPGRPRESPSRAQGPSTRRGRAPQGRK